MKAINSPMNTNCSPLTSIPCKRDRRKGIEHYQWRGSEVPYPPGQMFGFWRLFSSEAIRGKGDIQVWCECQRCGGEKELLYLRNLEKGFSKSCVKCSVQLRRERKNLAKWGKKTLSHNDRVLQERWNSIKHRCCNPKNSQYSNYGGRGIQLSEEFQNDVAFVNYVASLPDCPEIITKQHTLDRIDTNKGYERGNLRFATQIQQMRNLQATAFLCYKGETYDARSFCERFLSRYRPHVVARLAKAGTSAESILQRDKDCPWVGRRWGRKSV